ncbi:MAG: hypothetical protein ABI036_11785 [Fibrobacteria bacterium]
MNLQYLNWKIYLENPAEAEPDEWFKVFSTWIPDAPEIFIDVADYKHVPDGPVTLLVGHYVNYSLDATGRRLGLLYDYKHPLEGVNEEKIRTSLLGLLHVAKRLEEDAGFTHKPKFNPGELRLIVNSRALAPNTPASLEAVKPDLTKVLAKAFGEGGFSLEHPTDPRQRFSVLVNAKATTDLAGLIKRLG